MKKELPKVELNLQRRFCEISCHIARGASSVRTFFRILVESHCLDTLAASFKYANGEKTVGRISGRGVVTLENEIIIDSGQLTDITYLESYSSLFESDHFWSGSFTQVTIAVCNWSVVVSNFTFTNFSDVPSNSIKPMSAEGELIN